MSNNTINVIKSEFKKEFPDFVSFIKNQGNKWLTIILFITVAILGLKFYFNHKKQEETKATIALSQAKSVDDLENITVKFKSTRTAPLAKFTLGKLYFDSGDFDMALNTYTDFINQYPKHPLAIESSFNRISCIEARGETQKALTSYQEFFDKHTDHFLANIALFAKARCLGKLNKWKEAKTIYEDYIIKNPNGIWFQHAEAGTRETNRHLNPDHS